MDPSWQIVLEILILLAAALALGTLADHLRQSPIIGYLVAGTLVGPQVLGWVSTRESVDTIAELGVSLLLFTIGLEFSFRRLKRLGRIALVGGTLQVVVTLAAAAAVAGLFGASLKAAVAIGAMIALSSTASVLRLLLDRAAIESVYGRSAVGILLLQDISVIPLMLLVATMSSDTGDGTVGIHLLRAGALLAVLIAAFFLIFNVVTPRILNLPRLTRTRELPILLAIVMALGSATAAHEASLSPAMGAFIAGVLLGESPFAVQIRADVAALRTVLVTLFFASIGLIGEPMWALANWHLVLGAVAAIVFGKTAIVWAIGRSLGLTHGLAIAAGLCVAQVGEFSFVLAEVAVGNVSQEGGVPIISQDAFRLIVSATITTLFLTPFLVQIAPHVADVVQRKLTRRRGGATAVSGPVTEDEDTARPDIFIIGFGPAGRAVAEALHRRHRDRLSVIDLNPSSTRVAERYGLASHVGDATHRDVLEHAGVYGASVVVVTIPDPAACRSVIEHCKTMTPGAPVIARARYHARRWELQLAGAAEVVDEEEQVGLRLAAEVRRQVNRQTEEAAGDGASS